MSYETFRTDLAYRVMEAMPNFAMLDDVLEIMDSMADAYAFERKCTDLIVYESIPDEMRLYLASKTIEHLSVGTIKNYYNTLRMFFDAVRKPITEITTNDVRAYLNQYSRIRNVQGNTLNQIKNMLNGFFDWCVDDETSSVTKNPIRRKINIKFHDKERLPMTALELEKVRSACENLREKAMVDFLYSSAARVSEFCALNKSDINWLEHTVRIHHGKGDKPRTTYLNPEAEISLRAYLATRKDDSEALFVIHRAPHNRMGAKAVQDEVKRIVSRVDLNVKVTPHIFRHTAASLALQRGMPIEQVQKFLGHSKIQTTLRYAKVLDFDVRLAHGKYVA